MNARVFLIFVVLASFVVAAAGCSKSSTSQASSESSSDSSRSSSKSSRSSSRSSGDASYIGDTRDATAQWALSGGDVAAFKMSLGEIAKKNGVTDWENYKATYEGIGRGLKRAGVSGARYEQLRDMFASTDEQKKWTDKGYKSEPK